MSVGTKQIITFRFACGHEGSFGAYGDFEVMPCDCTGQIVVCPYHVYINDKKRQLEATLCAQCAGEEHG